MKMYIINEIGDEIEKQNRMYGDQHDDQHNPRDWSAIVVRELAEAPWSKDPRQAFLKVAAVAISAVESLDRKSRSEEA